MAEGHKAWPAKQNMEDGLVAVPGCELCGVSDHAKAQKSRYS